MTKTRLEAFSDRVLMKKLIILLFILPLLSFVISAVPENDFNPGIDRWTIKTSVPASAQHKNMRLQTVLSLKKPYTGNISSQDPHYDENRFTRSLNSSGLKEGDLVTTKGYLHLVAVERAHETKRDGDYHVQITGSPVFGDSCLVVEIPYPPFVTDPALRQQVAACRQFVKERLLKNKEPGTSGNIMKHEVYVEVTGQLFYDLIHSKGTHFRGKKGMKSYTPWELHPVTEIKFAVKPH